MMFRLGLRRVPVLTLVVFAVTAAVSLCQLTFAPRLLADLERTPAGLHGDWWRTITTMTVQDGGWEGGLSNLLFLLALGAYAEQLVPRWRWAAGYLGAGLVGQFVAYSWQPTGGGNSVANCGLAAIIVMAVLARVEGIPVIAPPLAALWLGVLLATWRYPLVLVGLVAVWAWQIGVAQRWGWLRYALFAFAVAVGVLLCVVQNIHGAAILAGLVIAAVPGPGPLPAGNVEGESWRPIR
ncbi:MAG TPA: rhomboid family intramembrane serine protease [Micromonosporaceae bacterium]|jgi:membrane associated rhomboid family serine protease